MLLKIEQFSKWSMIIRNQYLSLKHLVWVSVITLLIVMSY